MMRSPAALNAFKQLKTQQERYAFVESQKNLLKNLTEEKQVAVKVAAVLDRQIQDIEYFLELFKNQGKTSRVENLQQMSERLKSFPPKSEQWFQEKFEEHRSEGDEFNSSLMGYIPDLFNKQFRYVVEIDGSIHDTKKQKEKDARRDRFFRKRDFIVLRIKAYDETGFELACSQIHELRRLRGRLDESAYVNYIRSKNERLLNPFVIVRRSEKQKPR